MASDVSKDAPYGLCPVCSLPGVIRCRCRVSDTKCAAGHAWHFFGDELHLGTWDHAGIDPAHAMCQRIRRAADEVPKLVPGYGFHLEGDGAWDIQKIPPNVLRDAQYSGELTIKGFHCIVFDIPDGDTWAQKRPGTPAPKGDEAVDEKLASLRRIATRMASSKTSKRGLEPNIARAALEMLDHLRAAGVSMDKARQFGRVLSNEPSLEWVIDGIEPIHDQLKELLKGASDSLDYLIPESTSE